MFALERQAGIAALVASQRRASVPEIAVRFGVSEATVRRDLEFLERSGKVRRAYGGAVTREGLSREIPIDIRAREHADAKAVIGRLAAGLVGPGDTIMLDASTTTLAMVEHLRGFDNLRVITFGLRTAQTLGDVVGQGVYLCGGELHPSTLSVTGYQAEEFVRNYYADKLFISARAISATEGIMDFSDADAHLKQAMLARAATKVLLLDSSKFGARAFSTIGGVGEIDYLITDQQPDGPLQSALEASGVEIILPRDRAQLCRADEPVQSGVASDTLETAREGDAWPRQ
jgi:DeoR/GlpR family transcriptional regulator of sugar metabolism